MKVKNAPTLFQGPVGTAFLPETFPAGNLLMDPSRYDYEGNWVFCRFDGHDVTAGRIGFGAGQFDGSDYGGKLFDPGLFYHLEFVTKKGAVLHLNSRYKASDVKSDPYRVHVRIAPSNNTLLEFEGWPVMNWRVVADDGRAEFAARLTPLAVTILPDTLLPSNRFSMWLTVGRIEATVRFDDESWNLTGSFFYDHPRIVITNTGAAPFGSYLYMPQRLSDGSHLAAYFTRDRNTERVDRGSYAIHFDTTGQITMLPDAEQHAIAFDDDGHPNRWRHTFRSDEMRIEADTTAHNDRDMHIWGSDAPPARRDNRVFPLVFDSDISINRGGTTSQLRGEGMAEFVRHPELPLDRI